MIKLLAILMEISDMGCYDVKFSKDYKFTYEIYAYNSKIIDPLISGVVNESDEATQHALKLLKFLNDPAGEVECA